MTAKKIVPLEEFVVGSGDHICYVYGLRFTKDGHKHNGRIRYVGKALDPWARFRSHRNPQAAHGRVQRSVLKNGAESFSLEILVKAFATSKHGAEKLALKWEEHFIAHLGTTKQGFGLNLTTGGEGLSFVGEAKRRHRVASQKVMREIKSRPEVRKKYSDLAKARFADPDKAERLLAAMHAPEVEDRRRATMLERYATDEQFHRRQADNLRRLANSPEHRKRTSKRTIEMNKNPVVRERQSEGLRRYNNEAVREAKAIAMKEMHKEPEFAKRYREGLSKRYSDPAKVAEHAAHTKERWANPALKRAVNLSIHLRWSKKHLSDGKLEAAQKQIDSIRALLAECGDDLNEVRMRDEARQFLLSLEKDAA